MFSLMNWGYHFKFQIIRISEGDNVLGAGVVVVYPF